MANIDNLLIPALVLDEVSAPSTPAATSVVVYAKADGLVYSKDDAGAETLMSSGAAAGVSGGTSNPGSPSTNDLFHRTDLGMIFRYNGTRWLCICPHAQPFSHGEAVMPLSITFNAGYAALDNVTLDLWIERLAVATTVLTTNDGTKFWTVAAQRGPSATSLGSFTTASDTAGTNTRHNITVGALSGTSDRFLSIAATKTSTPGTIYVFSTIIFRYVAA